MFNNPGKKLKTLAKVIFWLIIILHFFGALITSSILSRGEMKAGTIELLSVVVIVAIGVLVGWLASIVLYAFGEMVEDIHATREVTEETELLFSKYLNEQALPKAEIEQNDISVADPVVINSMETKKDVFYSPHEVSSTQVSRETLSSSASATASAAHSTVPTQEKPVSESSNGFNPGSEVVDQLKQFKELLDIGAITEEEYLGEKRKLLRQIR